MRYMLIALLMIATMVHAMPEKKDPDWKPLTPEEHRAKFDYRKVEALFDTPMRDCAITRGPEGNFYLTGTTADPSDRTDPADFTANDGIRLWRSADLKNWEPLGLVAPLSVVKAKVEDLGLVRSARYANEFQGLIAPELHHVKGDWCLTYALKPCGTGLLKSKTGKPEGPYEDIGLITKHGQDASLFVDDPADGGTGDGNVYWVFGGGWVAKMKDDLTGLAEEPRLIRPFHDHKKIGPGGQFLQVGTDGAFLFKKGGKYHMLAAGIHGRIGVPCRDTFVAVADSLDGPWTRRLVAVPHGGQATMFEGPDGQWYATFSGVDSRAALRDRPAIVPVNWVSSTLYYGAKGFEWPLKPAHIITEAWGWENARPLIDVTFRDIAIVNGRDGTFAFSGLHNDNHLNMANVFVRGKDLTGATPWELVQFPGLPVVTDLPWYEYIPRKRDNWGNLRMSSCKLFDVKGAFYATTSAAKEAGILRSTGKSIMGPWEVVKEKPYGSIHGSGHVKADKNGDLWLIVRSFMWPVTPDFEIDTERRIATEDGYTPTPGRNGSYDLENADGTSPIRGDVGRYFYKIDGKYLMMGTAWHGDHRPFGTYDNQMFWADDLIGPYRHNRTVLPHSGHAGIVKDDNGQWWATSFANDAFLPDFSYVRAVPVDIEWNGNGFTVRSANPGDPSLTWQPEPERIVTTGKDFHAALPVVKLPEDIVLQAPAVMRGPAGDWYLTGTAASDMSDKPDMSDNQERRTKNQEPVVFDFENNDGIYLWKSTDLKSWEPLGNVASIGGSGQKIIFRAKYLSPPLGYHFPPADSLEPRYDRGVIAPELHHINGDWWIVFSMSGHKIGLLKSKSGKPEGPYETWGGEGKNQLGWIADTGTDHGKNTDSYFFAQDPSLFVEGDRVFCVFGPGWIAPMNKEMTAFAELPQRLEIEGGLYAGHGGCQIRKEGGQYKLSALNEWGDTVEYTAASLHGPYGHKRLVLPQSGQAGMFQNADGVWTAVVK